MDFTEKNDLQSAGGYVNENRPETSVNENQSNDAADGDKNKGKRMRIKDTRKVDYNNVTPTSRPYQPMYGQTRQSSQGYQPRPFRPNNGDEAASAYPPRRYGSEPRQENTYQRRSYDRTDNDQESYSPKEYFSQDKPRQDFGSKFGDHQQRPYNPQNRTGGYQQGGGYQRQQGGGGYQQGGYRQQGGGYNKPGGYQQRGDYQPREPRGDYQPREPRGDYQPRERGDYQQRGEGGYQRQGGGYQQQGGYRQQGGYNKPSGGFQKPGGYQKQGGFQKPGGYQQGGGYRQQGGYQQGGFKQGGYQQRPGAGGFKPRAPRPVSYPEPIKYPAVTDPTLPIRLNKYLANAGVCSRREADEFIQAGAVKVNGAVITELGTKVAYTDTVMFQDQQVQIESKIYILLNKPKNCVTTSDDPQNRQTVMDLVKAACPERIYPVGRLDRNTTGVLLLTNDGEMAAKLTHPSFKKKKIYHVWVDREVEVADMEKLATGIDLEDGEIHADAISYASETDRTQIGIEIHSGRNRIVRRMFEMIGYHVIKLDRVYFAGLTKKNLGRGKWRYLSDQEVSTLRMGAYE